MTIRQLIDIGSQLKSPTIGPIQSDIYSTMDGFVEHEQNRADDIWNLFDVFRCCEMNCIEHWL